MIAPTVNKCKGNKKLVSRFMALDLLTAFWRRDLASAQHYRDAKDLAVHTSAGSRTELRTASEPRNCLLAEP